MAALRLAMPPNVRRSRVGQVERSDTCRFVRGIDGWQVSFLDLPYGLAAQFAGWVPRL